MTVVLPLPLAIIGALLLTAALAWFLAAAWRRDRAATAREVAEYRAVVYAFHSLPAPKEQIPSTITEKK